MSLKLSFLFLLVAIAFVAAIEDEPEVPSKLKSSLFANAETRSRSRDDLLKRIKGRKHETPTPSADAARTQVFSGKKFDRKKPAAKPASPQQQPHHEPMIPAAAALKHSQHVAPKISRHEAPGHSQHEAPQQDAPRPAESKRVGRFFRFH